MDRQFRSISKDSYRLHRSRYACHPLKSFEIGFGESTASSQTVTSSRAGNVSHVLPALHAIFAIPAEPGANPHTKPFAAAAGTDVAHQKAIIVGKTLALVAFDVLTKDDVYQAVKADWEREKARA